MLGLLKRPKFAVYEGTNDRLFVIANYVALAVIALAVLLPLWYIVSASFTSTSAVLAGRISLIPTEFSLDGYIAVFRHPLIWSGFANSLFYTVVGTAVNLVMTIMAGYALSRRELVGRNFILAAFVFTILFDAGLMPNFLLVKDLGMLNTRWALILPKALNAFNVLIAVTFFRTTIPDELRDAAQLDGCDEITFLLRIVLPLSSAIIAVLVLFYAVGQWNSYFDALIYLKDQSLYPLQIVLRDVLIQNQVMPGTLIDAKDLASKTALRELLKYALIVVASLPVLVLYPFIQRHFVKGLLIGSIK